MYKLQGSRQTVISWKNGNGEVSTISINANRYNSFLQKSVEQAKSYTRNATHESDERIIGVTNTDMSELKVNNHYFVTIYWKDLDFNKQKQNSKWCSMQKHCEY